MRRLLARLGCLAGLGCLGLTGCAAWVPRPVAPTPTATTQQELVAARRAAGIADCAPSTGDAAVAGGLPANDLDCLGGDQGLDLAGLRGPVVVNLWAQWCEPCRQEAPQLASLGSVRPDVALLGVNYDDPDPAAAIEFARQAGWTYPQLQDPSASLAGPLAVPGIPYSLLVDGEGRIVARRAGPFTTLDELTDWVDTGLAR